MRQLEQEYMQLIEKIQHHHCESEEIETFLNKAEHLMESKSHKSFNHVLEAYYYAYFVLDEDYEYTSINMSGLYALLSRRYESKGEYESAIDYAKKALKWNEVDVELFFYLISLLRNSSQKIHLEEIRKYSLESYPYLCTKADLARFYRNLGFYYMESYKPELAEVLYAYSQFFYQTDQAEQEICFVEKALKRKRKTYTITQLQQILHENEIPTEVNPMTLAIIYKAAEVENEAGRIKVARECYELLYQLTLDEEIKDKLDYLKKM